MSEDRNPFLISPPPGLLPPAPEVPAAAPAPEPAATRTATRQPAPTQTVSTVSLPARGAPRAGFATPSADAVFGRALSEPSASSTSHWRLALPDGRDVALEGAAYLGRAPAATAEHPDALLIAVQDEQRSVSKTHALLLIDGDAVLVHDLGSTNGTWVIAADGAERQALPGAPIAAVAGERIDVGALPVQLRAG